jgi:hypothetical protein
MITALLPTLARLLCLLTGLLIRLLITLLPTLARLLGLLARMPLTLMYVMPKYRGYPPSSGSMAITESRHTGSVTLRFRGAKALIRCRAGTDVRRLC